MILFVVKGEVDSDSFISFCYNNYRNLALNDLPSEAKIIREDNKKPRLDVEDVYFNLSHSHGVCVLAMGASEIGIDIEKIRDLDYSKFDFIDAQDKEDFFKEWTRRESYLKYTGKGLSNLRMDIPSDAHFEFFPVYDNYLICICAKEQDIIAYEIDKNAI